MMNTASVARALGEGTAGSSTLTSTWVRVVQKGRWAKSGDMAVAQMWAATSRAKALRKLAPGLVLTGCFSQSPAMIAMLLPSAICEVEEAAAAVVMKAGIAWMSPEDSSKGRAKERNEQGRM